MAVALGLLVLFDVSLLYRSSCLPGGHPALIFTKVGFHVAFISNVLFGVGIGLDLRGGYKA